MLPAMPPLPTPGAGARPAFVELGLGLRFAASPSAIGVAWALAEQLGGQFSLSAPALAAAAAEQSLLICAAAYARGTTHTSECGLSCSSARHKLCQKKSLKLSTTSGLCLQVTRISLEMMAAAATAELALAHAAVSGTGTTYSATRRLAAAA